MSSGSSKVAATDPEYIPSIETLEFMVWRHTYFEEPNLTPLFHYRIAEHYLHCEESGTRAVRAFRGSAKTSNTSYHCLYRVDKGLDRYILILSDTQTQAESIISDITDMAAELPHLKVSRAIAGEIEFIVNGKKAHIVGRGISGSLRGLRKSGLRAGLIVGDDLINDELAANKVRRDRLIRHWYKAVLPSLDPKGRVWVVGTPLSDGDLFMHLCRQHPTIDVSIATFDIGSDGVETIDSNWPDRFSNEWIRRKKKQYSDAGMLPSWKQEMELILVDDETNVFDINRINMIDEDSIPDDLTFYSTLDGAFSEKDASDYSAFTVLGIDKEHRWYVWTYAMKANPQEVISKLFELQAKFGFNAVGIEKGQFLLSMKVEVERLQLDYQQWFSVEELSTSGSKLSRIKALAPVVNSGRMSMIDTGVDSERLMDQFKLTDHIGCKSATDDQIDSCCQLLQMDTTWTGSHKFVREDYIGSVEKELPWQLSSDSDDYYK